jgi:hypothetical protein
MSVGGSLNFEFEKGSMARAVVQPPVNHWPNHLYCLSFALRETETVLNETCMCRNMGRHPKGHELPVRGPETRWQIGPLKISMRCRFALSKAVVRSLEVSKDCWRRSHA